MRIVRPPTSKRKSFSNFSSSHLLSRRQHGSVVFASLQEVVGGDLHCSSSAFPRAAPPPDAAVDANGGCDAIACSTARKRPHRRGLFGAATIGATGCRDDCC